MEESFLYRREKDYVWENLTKLYSEANLYKSFFSDNAMKRKPLFCDTELIRFVAQFEEVGTLPLVLEWKILSLSYSNKSFLIYTP